MGCSRASCIPRAGSSTSPCPMMPTSANGLDHPFPSNRITLYVAPPASDPDLQNYDSWLRVVTTHELTHVFHLDRARGFWGSLQHVFGRGPLLFPNEYQPTWVIEGLATYYESALTNGGRVKGTLHTQVLAAGALGGTARSPWNALFFSRWPGGVAPYAYGSRFFRYLADSPGRLGGPALRRRDRGAADSVPRGPPALARHAERSARRGVAPRHATRGGGGRLDRRRARLDRGLWTEPVPRVSPDRRRLAYVRDDGKGRRRLYIVSTEDWRRVRTHHVTDGVSYDWLGDTLIVSQLDYTSRWQLRSDLYRWLPDGRWTRTTRGARLQQPRAGGDRLSTIELVPGGNRPTLLGTTAPTRARRRRDLGRRRPFARRPLGGRHPPRRRALVPGALAGGGSGATRAAVRVSQRCERRRVDSGRGAVVRERSVGVSPDLPLVRVGRAGGAHGGAPRSPSARHARG